MANNSVIRNLERIIDRATNEELKEPDFALYQEACDAFSRPDAIKDAIRLVSRKITTGKPKVQFLALELLEATTNGCELPFHTQLGSKDFLRILTSLLQRELVPPVRDKLLFLLQFWSEFFENQQDILPQFKEQYLALKKKGIQFPASAPSKYSSLRKNKSQGIYMAPVGGSRSEARSTGGNASKFEKLKKDLDVVKENMTMANEMIDAADPAEDVRKNDILIDLVKTFKGMEEKLRRLIGEITDEDMLKFCLELNDDLLQTLERFESLRKGRRPAPFFRERDFIEKEREEIQRGTGERPSARQVNLGDAFFDFGPSKATKNTTLQKAADNLIDLLSDDPPQTAPAPAPRSGGDLLDDLQGLSLGGPAPQQRPAPSNDLFNLVGPAPTQAPVQQQPPANAGDLLSMMYSQTAQPQQRPQPQPQPFPGAGGFPVNAGGFNNPGFPGANMQPTFPGAGGFQPGFGPGLGQPGGFNPLLAPQPQPNPGFPGGYPAAGGFIAPGAQGGFAPRPAPVATPQMGAGGIRMGDGPTLNQLVEAPKAAPQKTAFDDIVDGVMSNELNAAKQPSPSRPGQNQAEFSLI